MEPISLGVAPIAPPRRRVGRHLRRVLAAMALLVLVVAVVPDYPIIPVRGATAADWNVASFWYYPWGESVVHKGIDIFSPAGTQVNAATAGLVLYSGKAGRGGNIVLMLGPRWRLHYYAHLEEFSVVAGDWRLQDAPIGRVGSTGNAAGKPPHLHYSVVTLVPYPWRWSAEPQGWMKMFFLDPGSILDGRGGVADGRGRRDRRR